MANSMTNFDCILGLKISLFYVFLWAYTCIGLVEQINVEVQKWESIEVCFVATNCKGKRQTKIRTSDLKIN